MKDVFVILGCLCIVMNPCKVLALPVTQVVQTDEKPKKEVLISLNSTYYRNAKEVLEGFFKQANIKNKYIDSALDNVEKKNFSFVDFTLDEAMNYLSSKYNVQFVVETIGKKKIYNVEPKKK
jgi:hypothetical protein